MHSPQLKRISDFLLTSACVRGQPLSIVIVGVGNADFDAMDVLDADEEPLRCHRTRQLMKRDIVQFVPYRDFKHVGVTRLVRLLLLFIALSVAAIPICCYSVCEYLLETLRGQS